MSKYNGFSPSHHKIMGENVINDIIMPKIHRIIIYTMKRRSTMNIILHAIHEMSKNILHAMNKWI